MLWRVPAAVPAGCSAAARANARFAHTLRCRGMSTDGSERETSSVTRAASLHHGVSVHAADVAKSVAQVVLALGSNLGDRAAVMEKAVRELNEAGVRVSRFSSLYESAPAYVTDQPAFLNAAVRASTTLAPDALLDVLKRIESKLGRTTGGVRFGPRVVDLDIVFYGRETVRTERLEIPHPRLFERPFVLAPLFDLWVRAAPGSAGPSTSGQASQSEMDADGGPLAAAAEAWRAMGGEKLVGGADGGLARILPLPGGRTFRFGDRTLIMGILNATPDSFSDGGLHQSARSAEEAAARMVEEGADIIDVGGQSTRPGAELLSPERELERVAPVLEALRARFRGGGGPLISIDTFHSKVAREAVRLGADIVNDVSGGYLDPEMGKTVGELSCPYVLMHMRGAPETMQQASNTAYDDICADVARELGGRLAEVARDGVPSWRVVPDPGLGFAKTKEGSFELVRRLPELREALARQGMPPLAPLLLGPSRKGFIGAVTGRAAGPQRDWGTAAAVSACVGGGADIVRIHNVAAGRDAARVAEGIWARRRMR